VKEARAFRASLLFAILSLLTMRGLPKAFWLLWFGQTFNRAGVLAPAFLVLYLEGSKLTDARTTPLVVGFFGAGVVMAGLVGGLVADLIGERRTIIIAELTAVVTALLLGISSNLLSISLLALLAGVLSTADRPVAAGLIARLVPQQRFAQAYSLFLSGFNVGMAVGPVLSGLLLTFYPPGLFLLWSACSLIYAALVWILPADPARPEWRQPGTSLIRNLGRGVAEPFRSPALRGFLLLTFLLALVYLQLNSTLPLDMRLKGLRPAEIGLIFALNAVLPIALLPLVPRVVRGMRVETPLAIASVLIGIGFGMQALAHDVRAFAAALIVWTLGEILWGPTSTAFLAKEAPAGRFSVYQGAYFLAWNAAFVIGGPIGLTVANRFGYGRLWIATLILGLAAGLGFKLLGRTGSEVGWRRAVGS
jgi:MFS family permease